MCHLWPLLSSHSVSNHAFNCCICVSLSLFDSKLLSHAIQSDCSIKWLVQCISINWHHPLFPHPVLICMSQSSCIVVEVSSSMHIPPPSLITFFSLILIFPFKCLSLFHPFTLSSLLFFLQSLWQSFHQSIYFQWSSLSILDWWWLIVNSLKDAVSSTLSLSLSLSLLLHILSQPLPSKESAFITIVVSNPYLSCSTIILITPCINASMKLEMKSAS